MLRKVLNNIFLIDNKDYIEKAKEVGINTFLFPFKGYAFGFNNYFELDEINEENSYIYINRNLDCNDIDNLKEIFKNIKSNIKGVFFEDIGLIPVLENTNLERIIFSHHLTTNYESINNYLKYVDSVIISTDITEEEMIEDIIMKYQELIIKYRFTKEEHEVIIESFERYIKTIKGYQMADVGLETNEDRKVEKIKDYGLEPEDIEESFFIPLYFDNKVLLGRKSELYKRRQLLRQYIIDWDYYTEEEKQVIKLRNKFTEEEINIIESTRKDINKTIDKFR